MPVLQPGTYIGTAKIVSLLGSGSVAAVYEVLHEGARRALKVVEGGISGAGTSSMVEARLAQESETIAMIEHVNVVRWYGSGVDDGRVWILLELVEGRNLRELLLASRGRLPLERAVRIARHACDGLAAVHKKSIVHRDMKPENILVTAEDLAKVADFGSAKLPGWGVKTTNARRLTSALYTPPEVCTGAAPDPRGDVYAMGLILYEVIAGVHPVVPGSADIQATYARHLHYEPPPLALVEDVPSDLSALVQRAIAKDPARRCTMRELADVLADVLDRLLVWRRSAARELPLPSQDPRLALTVEMPVYPSSSPASAPVSAEPTGRSTGGTLPMPAPTPSTFVAARAELSAFEPQDEPQDELHSGDREAAPPPAPSLAPPTLKSFSRPPPAMRLALVAEPDGTRRSTTIPVESTAHPSAATPRRRVLHGLIAGGALAVLTTASWWTLSESEPRPAPRPASPPPASVSPPPSASIARPPPSATPPRRAPIGPAAPRR